MSRKWLLIFTGAALSIGDLCLAWYMYNHAAPFFITAFPIFGAGLSSSLIIKGFVNED